MELTKNWKQREPELGYDMGMTLDEGTGVFLSYQPNTIVKNFSVTQKTDLDSISPETAIVLQNDKPDGKNRYLIYRGDWRAELEKLFPDVEALKEHWKEYGGQFWTDTLKDEE